MSGTTTSAKTSDNARLTALEREVQNLRRQLMQMPSRFPVAAASDGASIRQTIKVANTFAAEDVVCNIGGAWELARANAATSTAKYTGVVESADAESFVIVYAGRIELALSPGTTYYLSDTIAGLVVVRASITLYQLTIPVLRCISGTECIVMPGRDIGSDLSVLTAGDLANGGGELVINIGNAASEFYLTADETDGLIISTDADSAIQMHPDGHITIDQSNVAISITAGVLTIDYGSGNTVTINPAHFVGTNKDVRLREVEWCDPSGVDKKFLMLMSDAY